MLKLVELEGFEKHYPWQLSGGMQQRVSIARALSFSPALLLMDEPFGALDEMTRERLNAELLRIWAETGSTVIFVTHSISEAVYLSTRVVVMSPRPGRITAVVPIDLPQPRTFETREEPRFFELVTEVREALHASGADEVEPSRRRMSTVAQPLRRARAHERRAQVGARRSSSSASGSPPGSGSCRRSASSATCCRRSPTCYRRSGTTRPSSSGRLDHVQGSARRVRARLLASRSCSRSCSRAGARSATR